MKQTVLVQKSIDASPDKVWATVRTGKDLDLWLPMVTNCKVDGMSRVCTLADGGKTQERLISTNDAARTVTYSVDKHPMPLGPVLNTIRVERSGDHGSRIDWSAEFDADEATLTQVRPMFEGLFNAGIDGLAALHGM